MPWHLGENELSKHPQTPINNADESEEEPLVKYEDYLVDNNDDEVGVRDAGVVRRAGGCLCSKEEGSSEHAIPISRDGVSTVPELYAAHRRQV